MDFVITKEQIRIQKAAREFLKAKFNSDFVREMEKDEKGYTRQTWKKMGELDWMALIIPEEYDGVGGSLFDLVLLLEEFGRVGAQGPFFATVVLGGFGIARYGNEEQKKTYLPKIANGEIIVSLALEELGTTQYDPYLVSTAATPGTGNYTLNGRKLFVTNANSADILICAARTSGETHARQGVSIFLVDTALPGIEIEPLETIGGDKQFEVVFNDVVIDEKALLGIADNGGEVLDGMLDYAVVCKCAEMVGGAQRVLEMSADYAKMRKQFGKAIGSFQAIQHHCANMLIKLEGSRYITYKAAWLLENNEPFQMVLAAAKAWVSDSFKEIVALGHQVQGGSAFMEEHDMPLFSRRAAAAAVTFGDSAYHRKKVLDALGL